jgi:hypothetical protein
MGFSRKYGKSGSPGLKSKTKNQLGTETKLGKWGKTVKTQSINFVGKPTSKPKFPCFRLATSASAAFSRCVGVIAI